MFLFGSGTLKIRGQWEQGERPMSNAHVPSRLPPASFANGQLKPV